MDTILREVQIIQNESTISTHTTKACAMGTNKVQKIQNKFSASVQLAKENADTISVFILPLETWILLKQVLDLYNKSRVMGDYQARFCERLGVKFPLPTRPRNRYTQV